MQKNLHYSCPMFKLQNHLNSPHKNSAVSFFYKNNVMTKNTNDKKIFFLSNKSQGAYFSNFLYIDFVLNLCSQALKKVIQLSRAT